MKNFSQAESETISLIRHRTAEYGIKHGRRPRILITRSRPNSSDREVKARAAAFADMGFDVDINTAALTPSGLARIAAENDVHAIGIPEISYTSEPFIAELLRFLADEGGRDIRVFAWMTVQTEGFKTSLNAGKLKIFESETDDTDSADQILDDLCQESQDS